MAMGKPKKKQWRLQSMTSIKIEAVGDDDIDACRQVYQLWRLMMDDLIGKHARGKLMEGEYTYSTSDLAGNAAATITLL